MRVTNQIESAVQAMLDDECRRWEGTPHVCSCPLCRADIAALALTNLPPRYVTEVSRRGAGAFNANSSVRAAVAAAARRVAVCPRHGENIPEEEDATVRIINFVFEEVARLALLCSLEDSRYCFCDRCTADMMAYSLNRYPSKYGVLWRGRHNLSEYQQECLREDLDLVLRRAAEVVTSNPAH